MDDHRPSRAVPWRAPCARNRRPALRERRCASGARSARSALRPNVSAGRIRLGNPPSHTGPVRPVNGNSAHLKPTYWIRIRPMKNTGIDTPATEQAMMTRSARRPRLTAASVPSARPLGTAISIAPSISSTVGPDGHRQFLAHHPVGNDGAAEIAAQHTQDVFEELDRDRSVEAEFLADRGDGLGLGVGPGDDHRRIGRHDLQQTKTEEENPEQGGERNQQTMDNLLSHATPTDRLGQREAPPPTPTLAVPSLAAALRPTCAAFDYPKILACVRRGVTPNLLVRSGCVVLRFDPR